MADERGRPGNGTSVSVAQVEALIRDLPGVLGARIVVNDWGGIREVHVLADASRQPKGVVRDIESGLAARWGLIVDRKRVSVAQLTGVPPRPKWVRVRIQRLAVSTDPVRSTAEVSVTLAPDTPRDIWGRPVFDPEIPDEVWEGKASGSNAGGLGVRLAATAALAAQDQSLLPGHTFTLEDVGSFQLNGRELVVVLIHYRGPRGAAEILTGSAVVRGEPLEAAVRAVLAATNRIYGLAMRRGQRLPGSEGWADPEVPDWVREGIVSEPEAAAASEDAPAPSGGDGEGAVGSSGDPSPSGGAAGWTASNGNSPGPTAASYGSSRPPGVG
jgi:hypothetical protein